jgi:signal transduction histidine kinase
MPHDDAVTAARMRSLARLARPTAHELRGALNTVQLQVEVLAASPGDVPGRSQRCLDAIRAECKRVERIAEAFLALADLPSSSGETDVGGLVGGVIEAVRPLAATRRVRIDSPPCTPWPCYLTEPEGCRQRLLDALTDAIAGAPAGATVAVELAPDWRWARVCDTQGARVDVQLLDPAGEGRA